ncbi:hypothetical protein J1605_017980, partial [Eschrichtius robustus]
MPLIIRRELMPAGALGLSPLQSEWRAWSQFSTATGFRLVVKTALKLLLVFVEYSESNAPLLIQAVSAVDTKR